MKRAQAIGNRHPRPALMALLLALGACTGPPGSEPEPSAGTAPESVGGTTPESVGGTTTIPDAATRPDVARYFIGIDAQLVAAPGAPGSLDAAVASLKVSHGIVTRRISRRGFVGLVVDMRPPAAAALAAAGLPWVRYVRADAWAAASASCQRPPPEVPCIGPGAWGPARMRHDGWPIPGPGQVPPCAWRGGGVHVVLLDSGVDANHPQFATARLAGDGTWVEGEPLHDTAGHGTAVAGIVVGADHGLAPDAMLHSLRVLALDQGRLGALATTLDAALERVQTMSDEMSPLIVLACWNFREPEPAIDEHVTWLREHGAIVVASAGNQPAERGLVSGSPVTAPGCIAVGALDACDRPWPDTVTGPLVSAWAPGVHVAVPVTGGAWHYKDGTSMAAPHVAGVLAQLMGEGLGLPPEEAVARLWSDAADGCLDEAQMGGSANRRIRDIPCAF